MFSFVCPGLEKVIVPPQTHIRHEVSGSALIPATVLTFGEPGVQGAGVLGTQGMGVRTPAAAAVADAVAGNAGERQTPKGGMFTIGLWSRMFPASMYPDFTCFGVAMKLDGAAPMVQRICAEVTACLAKFLPSKRLRLWVDCSSSAAFRLVSCDVARGGGSQWHGAVRCG